MLYELLTSTTPFDKDRLHAIGLDFEPSWATGNKLRDMQAPPKPARAAGKGDAKESAE